MSKLIISGVFSILAIIAIFMLTKNQYNKDYKIDSVLHKIESDSKDIAQLNQYTNQDIDSLQSIIDSVNRTLANFHIEQKNQKIELFENYQYRAIQDFQSKKDQLRQKVANAFKNMGDLRINLNCVHVEFIGTSNDRAAMEIYMNGRYIGSPTLNRNNSYSYSKQLFSDWLEY